ncbi:SAM-dependent chlorinase/fluorinase [Actinokineospora auranticolor]|uniref:SAM-dependent chlorinase/fluorinase n=1 Tax=Actinokineospora auranticolor TaxID=155976 RepID=A0A2S6GRM3_9PSEU|nr:SAM-dependent chlorinase/fluorinase [Actinokineospora auranticolor]PPK67849.1 hypothetical protein CLV40_10679 [Actinokineospora auranticolor]
MGYDWISFTTDYGLADAYPGVCEGVIGRIAPRARVLHLSHAVPAQDVRRGAAVLAQAVGYLPPAVHLAVVDPGVGTDRRPVAVVAGEAVLVGPDNGLLVAAAGVLGGITAAYELTEFRLEQVSATFHGRDVFAPTAAHLARGARPDEVGPAVDPAGLVRLPAPVTQVEAGRVTTEVLGVDGFGNVQLAATRLDAAPGTYVHAQVGDRSVEAVVGRTFADAPAGSAVLLVDSAGHLAIAVNAGSAAAVLTPRPGAPVVLLLAT